MDLIEEHWPYDGPHTDDRTNEAALAIERLTRYLANATRYPSSMVYPSTIDTVTKTLSMAVHQLQQISRQTILRLELRPLGDYRDDRDQDPGDTIAALENALGDVIDAAGHLSTLLGFAAEHASHLGLRSK